MMEGLIQIWNRKSFWLIPVTLTVLLHAAFLGLPPKSMHIWRQSHTLAVTRNFYEESMNILEPRVDNRFNTSGVTGSQFPAFEYGLAIIYHITGEQYIVQRSYCLLLHIVGILGIIYLTSILTGNMVMANLTGWTYAWSPLLFYYGITVLPDNVALPFSIWGLYFFLRWFGSLSSTLSVQFPLMGASFVFLTLAGLTKIQYLAAGFFLLAYVWTQKDKLRSRDWFLFIIFGAGVSALSVSWYFYARYLIQKSGLTDFGLEFKPEDDLARALKTLWSNLVSTLPENLLNYSSFIFLVAGVVFALRKNRKYSPLMSGMICWSLILLLYHIIELRQMEYHDYYMMPYLPVLCLLSAFGCSLLLQGKYRNFALGLLLLQPVLAGLRIIPSRFMDEETPDKQVFYDSEKLKVLQNCVPDSTLCIIGPDNSRCIYFYFLHKKGFGFGDEGLSREQVKDYISRGARYLYVSDNRYAEESSLKDFTGEAICKTGNFVVYPLKK